MNRILLNEENLLRYGVDSGLAQKAANNSLTLSKIRSLSALDITSKFAMTEAEASELKKCVLRQPIDIQIVGQLLNASNFICSVCKGSKGHAYIIHHIDPYEETQDNSYGNLIVLCPTDHDLAHRSGLTLSITKRQLLDAKDAWELEVKRLNSEMASRTIDLNPPAKSETNENEDEKTLRYLMNFIRFTSLSSDIYHLPRAFDTNFLDVSTIMDALVVDRPHAYPFTNPALQSAYGDYLEKYYALYRLIVGGTNGIPHFLNADVVGNRLIARRNKSHFTHAQNTSIDDALANARDDFEDSYRKLISFLRQNYPKIKLDAYDKF